MTLRTSITLALLVAAIAVPPGFGFAGTNDSFERAVTRHLATTGCVLPTESAATPDAFERAVERTPPASSDVVERAVNRHLITTTCVPNETDDALDPAIAAAIRASH